MLAVLSGDKFTSIFPRSGVTVIPLPWVAEAKIFFDPVGAMIDDIMGEFDFGKVYKAMIALNWKWLDAKEGTPTLDELRKEAKYLLKRAAELRLGDYKDEHWEQGIMSATGGFQAMAFCNEDKTKVDALDLKFVLTEWDAEIED